MVILVTCKNEEDPIKNEGSRVRTTFLLLLVISFSDAQGQLTPPNSAVLVRIGPKFELVRDIMVVLLTCKNEKDQQKKKALEC